MVDVYYEVLCPDSRYFIMRQLHPAWKKASDMMEVRLKPYGKATHKANGDGGFTFECQHRAAECEGNAIHACAAHHLKDADALMEYVTCMMGDNYDPKSAGRECAKRVDAVEWETIAACAYGLEGQRLLAGHGDDTHALRPKVSFIPTIVVDGAQGGQRSLLKNFLAEVCRRYRGGNPPEACTPHL